MEVQVKKEWSMETYKLENVGRVKITFAETALDRQLVTILTPSGLFLEIDRLENGNGSIRLLDSHFGSRNDHLGIVSVDGQYVELGFRIEDNV